MKILIYFILGFISFLIFIKGFFPIRFKSSNRATFEDYPLHPLHNDLNELKRTTFYNPPVKKLVLVIVDAMRYDFISNTNYLEKMPFAKTMLETGKARLFKSIAKTPTVTMPRIKALTSGSITSFVDVLFNMEQSAEFKQDNFVYQLKSSEKSTVFYGDDTWLRLFPNTFKRHDGTTSFYVNDYIEVDKNVTRHIDDELSKNDWDVMILHYLGLDHIGHISGPRSIPIYPKLSEMDLVLKKISRKLMNQENTMLILTSDHGMSASGSHGGATPTEIECPLFVLSSSPKHNQRFYNFSKNTVQQVDIAPSISLALGIPIPLNSMGKTIPYFIKDMSSEEKLLALQYNTYQLLQHLNSTPFSDGLHSKCYERALDYHTNYLKKTKSVSFEESRQQYLTCQEYFSAELTSNIADYNIFEIVCGMSLTCFFSVFILIAWLVNIFKVQSLTTKFGSPKSKKIKFYGFALVVGTVLDIILLGGSSFVEEEHQIWQFLTSSILISLFFGFSNVVYSLSVEECNTKFSTLVFNQSKSSDTAVKRSSKHLNENTFINHKIDKERNKKLSKVHVKLWNKFWLVVIFVALCFNRLLKSWNQTGIKYVDLPDIADYLNKPQNNSFLSFISIIGLLGCSLICDFVLCTSYDKVRSFLTWIVFLSVYQQRHSSRSILLYGGDQKNINETIFEARLVYFIISLLLVNSAKNYLDYIMTKTKNSVLFVKLKNQTSSLEKALDCFQIAIVAMSALLLRSHNHPVLLIHLFLFVVIVKGLWPVFVEDKGINFSLVKEGKFLQYKVNPIQGCLRIVLAYWFSNHLYFILGNSNGFATIDLSSAYIGLSSSDGTFNTVFAILQCVFSTYIGHIMWMMLIIVDLIKNCNYDLNISNNQLNKISASTIVLSTLIVIRLCTVAFYLVVVFALRYHLFIWSVFAPKLLYEVVSTSIYVIIVFLAKLLWR